MVAMIEMPAEEAELNAFPVRIAVGCDDAGKWLVRSANGLEEFLELATNRLDAAKALLNEQKGFQDG